MGIAIRELSGPIREYLNAAVAVLFVLVFSSDAFAQSSRSVPKRNMASTARAQDGVAATIATDGALVFSKPDSTSSVLAQLPQGQSVRVSKGQVRGVDGVFRRIRVGNKIGYILNEDVAAQGSVAKAPPRSKEGKPEQVKKENREKDRKKKKDSRRDPIYFTRYIGLLVGESEFKEDISNVNASTSFPIYGFKLTGPDVLISGPVIDFNFALHYGVPSYYDSLSDSKPTGFVIFTDALLPIPLMQGNDSMLYFGIGPALVYSQFNVVQSGRLMDLKNLNLGLSLSLGGAYRFEKVALRFEAKYLVEKKSYRAIQASIQTEF